MLFRVYNYFIDNNKGENMTLSNDEKQRMVLSYEYAFSEAKNQVRAMKSGLTNHTRQDVAFNQIESGLAIHRKKLLNHGIDVKYFNHNDY